MIHSAIPQSQPIVIFSLFPSFVTYGRADGQTYVWTENLCENSDHHYHRPGLWLGLWINNFKFFS